MSPREKTSYHATFRFDPSGNWLADLVEVPQIHTFGKTLGKARENLFDALAAWLGQHILDVQATVNFECAVMLPNDAQEALDLARGAKEILEAVSRESNDLTAAAALALVDDAHLSVRDAAGMLEISHQRVHQIVSSVHAERRAEEVRRNLALVKQHMGDQKQMPPILAQLSTNQGLLAAALIIVGGALLAAAAAGE